MRIILSPVSKKCLLSISLGSLLFNSLLNEFLIEFADYIISLIGEPKISLGPNRNPPNSTILDKWVFENFILADEPSIKTLQIFETYVSSNNMLYGELVSSLEFLVYLIGRFKDTSNPFFIPDINLWSYELDNFTFNVL